MTPQKWYNLRQGQSLLVPGAAEADRGQCMQAADYALNEIYGLPYIWTDGAIDWWTKYDSIAQLKNHFYKVPVLNGYPKVGDFIIWGAGVGSIYGHVDLALQDGTVNGFLGADSNWGGNKTVHQVQHNYTSVLGYLRPNTNQGEDMPITKEMEMSESYKATGSYPGKDYSYPFVGSTDYNGMLTFWQGQMMLITVADEKKVAEGATGIPNVIGKDYNSPYVGKPVVSHFPQMSAFWNSQPKAEEQPFTVLKQGNYKVN